ncbi:hypothetical protein LBMAG42_27380 [Deltaproteobacteria bacterium]|nr:hypothetical protein LBMAG42_27380 [Deltaproteobacteria bacterium]
MVLGCGTGRVCRGLAGTRPITGLDRSAPMIERAAARGPESVRWVVGDMTSFSIGEFAEIIIPNASFAFLPDRAARAACLGACRAALTGGGPLTIDVPMPDFTLLGSAHTPEREAWTGRVNGAVVRRTREVFRAPVAQSLRLVDRYWHGEELLAESELLLHLFTADELEWMLEANGFYVEAIFGDHRGAPLSEGCARLLVRAFPLR